MALACVLCTTPRRRDRPTLSSYFLQVPAHERVFVCAVVREGEGGRERGREEEGVRMEVCVRMYRVHHGRMY